MNTCVEPLAEQQDASLYPPTDISPEQLFQAIGRLRKEARDEIDRLLSFLDTTDVDPDLEPHLGFPELMYAGLSESHPGDTDDREDDVDLESTDRDDDEDGRDDEPSLGSSLDHGAGALYRNVAADVQGLDLEDEHDGREPSLSGLTVETTYNDRDLEADDCDYEQDHDSESPCAPGSGVHQRRWSL
jgi:hypothetical protein